MTADPAFVTMIGRNLTYFEQLLQTDQNKKSGQFVAQISGLYRSIAYGAREPAANQQAAALFVASWSHIQQHSDYRQWEKLAVQLANRYAQNKADPFLLCRVVTLLGVLQQSSGDYTKAGQTFRSAERMALAKEDTGAVVNAWYYLATHEYKVRNHENAQGYLNKAQMLIEDELDLTNIDHRRLYGFTLNLLGLIHSAAQNYLAAQSLLEQAETVLASLGIGHYELIASTNLARLYGVTQQYGLSQKIYQKVIAYTKKYQLNLWHAQAAYSYSRSLTEQDRWEEASAILTQVDHVDLLRMGNLDMVATIKVELAKQFIQLDQISIAEPYLQEILTLESMQGDRLNRAIVMGLFGLIHHKSNDQQKAVKLLREVLEILDGETELTSFYEEYRIIFYEVLLRAIL